MPKFNAVTQQTEYLTAYRPLREDENTRLLDAARLKSDLEKSESASANNADASNGSFGGAGGMKLRYLHLGNYPPIKDMAVSFASGSPLQRECAIRFVVGVNGSGKSNLLRAVAKYFWHCRATRTAVCGESDLRVGCAWHSQSPDTST